MEVYRLVMQYKNPKSKCVNNSIIISDKPKVPEKIIDRGVLHIKLDRN